MKVFVLIICCFLISANAQASLAVSINNESLKKVEVIDTMITEEGVSFSFKYFDKNGGVRISIEKETLKKIGLSAKDLHDLLMTSKDPSIASSLFIKGPKENATISRIISSEE